jgi:putative ABC transport system permease protein
MHRLRAYLLRLMGLVHANQSESDFAAELESHIAMDTEEGVRAGLVPEEARRRALARIGGAEQARQRQREQRTLPWLDNLLRDLRYALRGFRRNPIFAITAIATLALGIGATTAVFSVVDRILFRSLPYAHDDRLVSVGLSAPIIPQEFMLGGSYYYWRDNQKPFEAFTSETGVSDCDLTEHNPAHLRCAGVEANFLLTLGVSPILGRNFLPEEDRPSGPKVALISYAIWQSHFAFNPGILNKLVNLDGKPVRVIGVLPKDFEMPTMQSADILVPQALNEAEERKADPGRVMYAFARLKPGISILQAQKELQPEFNYSLTLAPAQFRKEIHLRVRSVRDRQMHDVAPIAWLLLGAVLAVLLSACANVASLLITRAAARERELAVRSALGASWGRLARQALAETLILSLAGAAAGCLLAELLLQVFVAMAPAGIPFLTKAEVDPKIILFTLGVSLVCGIMFGLVPALKPPRATALGARTIISGGTARMRRFLVAGQIAISMVLLTGAALLLRSFNDLERQDMGMQSNGVVTAHIDLPRYRYATPQRQMDFYLQVDAVLRRLPGVEYLAMTDSLPPDEIQLHQIYSVISVEGQPHQTGGTGGMVVTRRVTPQYFDALGIPILRGRSFTDELRTSSQQYIILSSLLASRLFGESDPIGKRVKPIPDGPWYTVLGVAANVKNAGINGQDEPEFYRLRRNIATDWTPWNVVVLKTSVPPESLSPWIRSQIATIDPTLPVVIETMNQHLGKLAVRPRFVTALVGLFALCGLVMAVIGLYGVVAFLVTQRTQEIGVRVALGATRMDILRLIVGEGARLIALGGILGLGAAFASARLLKSVLFHIGAHDPTSFIAVSLLLVLAAFAATLIPARSAMKTDPMAALRAE